MENEELMSPDELKLRGWLSANDVYPGEMEMQSVVINSFYSEFEEQFEEDDLVPLDEVSPDELDLSEGFDYRAYEKSEEEEELEWAKKISYCLNNPEKLLTYINEEWRD